MARLVLTVGLFSLCALRALCGEPSLSGRIDPIARAHKGKIAVAVKHLGTGEEYYLDADTPMPTASLIKLAVMVEAYAQAEEGKVSLDKVLTLKAEDKVPGSGVLTDSFTPGATFALRDAVRLMVTVSDNTATNLVLGEIGLRPVGSRMAGLGLPETRIYAQVFKRKTTSIDLARSEKFGLGSTTARETVRLLELLHQGKVVTPKACEDMLGVLRKNQHRDMIVRFLPEDVAVAHKTGSVSDVRTDAGIISVPDPKDKKAKPAAVALCVLTDGNTDRRWVLENAAEVTIAKIAREVYDHFAAAK